MELLFYFINNTETIISDSYAAKQRKSSSKLLNRKKNGGQRNWFRKKSCIAVLHQRIKLSIFILALIFSYWPCFKELSFINS